MKKEHLIALAVFASIGGVVYLLVKNLQKEKEKNLGANSGD